MNRVKISPFKSCGSITAPPSKSIAHRCLIAAYLAGNSEISAIGSGDDVKATLNALKAMGARVSEQGDKIIFGKSQRTKKCEVDCKESGSTLRFLLPLCCALGINATFVGSDRLIKGRPNTTLIDTLNAHGADIKEMTVNGVIKGGEYNIDGSISSQYITGLLFALSTLKEDSHLIITGQAVSLGYIDITLNVLKRFGISITKVDDGFLIKGDQTFIPDNVKVEGDWSGAAFPLCMGAITGSAEVTNLNAKSTQGDRTIIDVLTAFGAKPEILDDRIRVIKNDLKAIVFDCQGCPDLAQIIAVTAAFAEGTTELSGIDRLKLKESDRLQGIIDLLTSADIEAVYKNGSLFIKGGKPKGGVFEVAPDHRSVMSAVVLAVGAEGESIVDNAHAVAKSYPDFFNDLCKLGGNYVNLQG